MVLLDEIILNHLHLSNGLFKLSCLSESDVESDLKFRGVFPHCMIYANMFIDCVWKDIIDGKDVVELDHHIYDDIDDRFFVEPVVGIVQSKHGINSSRYISNPKECNGKLLDGDKLSMMLIIMEVNKNTITKDKIRHMFLHEMLHAYEDRNRLVSNGEPLDDIFSKNNYYKNADALAKVNLMTLKGKMRYLTYQLNDSEINANAAAISSEYNKIKKEKHRAVLTDDDKLGIIKNTNAYNVLVMSECIIDGLKKIDDEDDKRLVLNCWNEFSWKIMDSFDKMMKYCEDRLYKLKTKFITNITYAIEKIDEGYLNHGLFESFDNGDDSLMRNLEFYTGKMPKVCRYFGDCRNTVDVDKMWNATEMTGFISGCKRISSDVILSRCESGDRNMPKSFLNSINDGAMCAIDDYQKIVVVYIPALDIHFFFDCVF